MRALHSGDLGDIISALPTIKALGGGELVIADVSGGNRERMKGERYQSIRSLLVTQSYITKVSWSDRRPKNITHDFTTFRNNGYRQGDSLLEWQSNHIGVQPCYDPWLEVEAQPSNLTVINRSSRYHNELFPWKQIVESHEAPIFVGLKGEHEAFESEFNLTIPYIHTPNLLDLAQLISGCKLFIGNQSAPLWIAFGLGVPIIQETWLNGANSILPRENCQYTRDVREINRLRALFL
jgi:hypothetical protein